MFIIIICKIIVIVLYSVEVILVCDYVIMWELQVLTMNYWEGGVKVTKCMYVWLVCRYLGEMVCDIVWLLYSPRVVVSGERYYACLILWVWLCDSSYESSIGILLQYVRIVCMLYSMYVCCMCIFCYYGEYVFLFIILCSFWNMILWGRTYLGECGTKRKL